MTIFLSVLAAAVLFFLLLYVFCIYPGHRPIPPEMQKEYAHRGLHGETVPENSLPAFCAAADAGYGIELDVQLTADGEVVVFHDSTLSRMTGVSGDVKQHSLAVLRTLRLNETEHTIPTLREVLDAVNGRVPLLIELKGESGNTALCPAVAKILTEYSGPYLIESFNPLLLRWFKRHRPAVLRGQLTTRLTKELGNTLRNRLLDSLLLNVLTRPDFLAYDVHTANRLPVRICTRFLGAARFVWTIRNPEEYALAKQEKAFSIFENFLPSTVQKG